MLKIVKRATVGIIKSRGEARSDYDEMKFYFTIAVIFSSFSLLFYPPLSLGVLGLFFYYFYQKIYSEYFTYKKPFYEYELAPFMTEQHYVQVGYEVYDDYEYLYSHLSLFTKSDKERYKKLKEKENYMKTQPHMIVGLSKEQLSRHLLLLGTTGAGKTSLIMNLLFNVMPKGGGAIFVDGKSDMKMGMKFVAISEDAGRLTDFYFVNFLNPEATYKDTNTFQPIATLSAAGQVVFLSSLAMEGSADGNMGYWFGRGKALLTPVIFLLYFRKKFYKENYSFETISQMLSANEFGFASVVLTVMAKALNEEMKRNKKLRRLLSLATKSVTARSDVPELESLVSYIIQNPHKTEDLELAGYKRNYIEALYRAYSSAVIVYLSSLSSTWSGAIKTVAEMFYEYLVKKGVEPLRISISEFRRLHDEFLKTMRGSVISSYLEPPQKDLEQHQYAQQQWTNVLQTFSVYSTVFGANDPDVDMLDVIRNGKFVYFLLPSLQADPKGREILGKIIVTAIKSACSFALGGKIEGLTSTQQRIIKTMLTPVPQGLVILDEYGSYPVPEIDVILAQVRSLNISTVIAVQDMTSLRVGGKDENSLLRAFGNTNKVFLKVLDKEALRELREIVRMDMLSTPSSAYYVDGEKVEVDVDAVSLQGQEAFDSRIAQAFRDGFSFMFVDGRGVFCQMFYVDKEEAKEVVLNRFEPLVEV